MFLARGRLAVVPALLAAACGSKPAELDVEKYRAPVLAALEAMARAAAEAKIKAPFELSWPDTTVAGLDFSDESGNAVMAMDEDLADLRVEPPRDVGFAVLTRDPVRAAKRLLGLVPGTVDLLAPDQAKLLERVARARYVLVVTSSAGLPIRSTLDKFTSGGVRGRALLYELDETSFVGAFPFAVSSSSSITVEDGADVESRFVTDLGRKFAGALEAGLELRFPGTKLPGFSGY